MQRKIKIKICGLFLLLLLGLNGFSQQNTTSPYSRYGIGDIVPVAKGRAASMGGVGLSLSSPYTLNSLNPASYAALDSMSFIYEIGASGYFSNYSTNSASVSHNEKDANFDYFNIAFPVTRWWRMGIGVFPVSGVGYNVSMTDLGEDRKVSSDDVIQSFQGSGGLSRVNFTHAFIPFKNLYLGLNVAYMFGQIERNKSVLFAESYKDASIFNTRQVEKITSKNIIFDLGMQYKAKINDDYSLNFGGVFNTKQKVSSDYEKMVLRTSPLNNKNTDNVGSQESSDYKLDYPLRWGTGLSMNYKNKWIVALDYTKESWSDINVSKDNFSFKDNENLALGFEYTPDRRSLRSYMNLISYRFGVHYTKSYLEIGSERINDIGLSFGFGFPLKRSATNLNIAFDLGKRGTKNSGLVEEKYAKISISCSIFSRWFYKQKYE